jgi:hypothetical protein
MEPIFVNNIMSKIKNIRTKKWLSMVTDITGKVQLQQLMNEQINKPGGVYGAYCFRNKTY